MEYDPLEMVYDGDDKIVPRLKFEKWRLSKNPNVTTPQTPLTDIIPAIHAIETKDPIDLEAMRQRRRNRRQRA